MTRKKVYFISDLHLGAGYLDSPLKAEKRVVRFLDSIKESAAEIYLVGDILDYWYEYKYVVPKGFVRFFGKLAELSDSGIKITWLIGNHDIWIFDYLPSELGIKVVDSSVSVTLYGKRFFIAHGDDIDDSSRSFKVMRSLFRNRFCQWLYAAIHPRWTIPFALGWSRQSRKSDCGTQALLSPDKYIQFAEEWKNKETLPDCFVFGHLHIAADKVLSNGSQIMVLGDWIDKFTYAVFDGENLTMHRFEQQ